MAFPSRRAICSAVLSLALLAVVPSAGLAGSPGPTCGETITTNVTLMADLDCTTHTGVGLRIGAIGITLDLNGFTIWGPPGPGGFGITAESVRDVTIANGTIANFGTGLAINESMGVVVSRVTVVGEADVPNDRGILATGGLANRFSYFAADQVDVGMQLGERQAPLIPPAGHVQYVISNSTISADEIGIDDYHGYLTRYLDNRVTAPTGFQVIDGKRTRLRRNVAFGGEVGFLIDCGSRGGLLMRANRASGNALHGFDVRDCPNASISGNRAKNNGLAGYRLSALRNAVVVSNRATYSEFGFLIEDVFEENLRRLSWNVANWNVIGFWASSGVPSRGNRARNNLGDACFNVRCR